MKELQNNPTIEIPFPCHENWDKMSAEAQGRFCNACSRTVIDFTNMSDNEVLNYLQKNTGKVCGRFTESQIDNSSRRFPEKLKVFLYALAVIFILNTGEVFAQSKVDTNIMQLSEKSMIYGRITDEKKQPLDFASVKVYKDGILQEGTKTDLNGKYEIKSLTRGDYNLKISLIGMETKEIKNVIVSSAKMKIDVVMTRKEYDKNEVKIRTHRYTMGFIKPDDSKQILNKEELKNIQR